ncbi:MAG TPA: lipoyl(octanoyl) transferase LipB [Myxococcota bacterium]|nr:lipoyl(octanoyl) transferase LipB [Myxococcota bacterium]
MGAGVEVQELGLVSYADAMARQLALLESRRQGRGSDVLLLLEHPPVVTLGRGAREENLRVPRESLRARGVELFEVARGGDVTWHGPGQLVGYPILDLAARGAPDLHAYLRRLEALLCDGLAALGVSACTRPGMTGVFVTDPLAARPRKIASIGVGVRGWVTWHGFALNVDCDLAGFECIVPCGLAGVEMTSVARELGASAPADLARRARDAVRAAFLAHFA